jgi:hypothetical protein
MQFKNDRPIKLDDAVVGIDWRGGVVHGTATTGDKTKGHDEFVFLHGVHKTVCPSLRLTDFLHVDDAVVNTTGIHSVTAKEPAPASADAAPGA